MAIFGHDRPPVAPEPWNFYAADFNAIPGMLPNPSITQRATGLPVAGSSVQVRIRVDRCLWAPLLDSLAKPRALTCSTVSCSFNSCLPPSMRGSGHATVRRYESSGGTLPVPDAAIAADETAAKKIIELTRLQNWLLVNSSTIIEKAQIL
jgi:hypothetical protein